jgi:RNA polymerase sigma-70 factor (ECF subfamily)
MIAQRAAVPQERADAFVELLAAEYGGDLVRFIAKRAANSADAEDIAQEAYVSLLQLRWIDAIRNPRSYLYRTAFNLLIKHQVKIKNDLNRLTDWFAESGDEDEAITAELEEEALRDQLDMAMRELSPKCRSVLTLKQQGKTYEQIGGEMEISVSMVKKYLKKGLQHSRERLRDFR